MFPDATGENIPCAGENQANEITLRELKNAFDAGTLTYGEYSRMWEFHMRGRLNNPNF
jgi:hypothetical protein